MGPTEIDADANHLSSLDGDNIPNDNQAHYCFSCQEPVQGIYCMACGQKNDNYRRGIFSLTWELFTSLTALEGRIWRTWRNLLLKPGRVAREYANGRRSHWSSPIRVYFAMSILLFAFMSVTNTHLFSLDIDVKPKDGIEKAESALTPADLDLKFSAHWFPRQSDINARNSGKNFDLITKKLSTYSDELEKELIEDGVISNETPPATETEDELNIDDFNIQIGYRNVDSARAIEFVIRFMKNPVMLTNSFNKWLPRVIFILMPFTILFSALFIRGKENAMLYDHLVHAAYIHAVAFFFLFIGIAFSRIIPGDILLNILFIGLLIYLPISLKHMFGRSWLKTFWTSYGVGLFYMVFLMIGLTFAILLDIGKSVTL